MTTLLRRLRKQKLVQWALAYLAGAWVMLQALEMVGQRFGWPVGLMRGAYVFAAIGFLATLILAWYHGERGEQRVNGVELLLLSLLLAIGGIMLWRFSRAPTQQATFPSTAAVAPLRRAAPLIQLKSVAVLPFVNESNNKDEQFFRMVCQKA